MKRPLLRGFVLGVAGSGALAVVTLLRTYLVAQWLGPAATGVWRAGTIALRLCVEGHAGALSVLAADAPIHRGAGRTAVAEDLERRASSLTLALAFVAAAIAAGVLIFVGGRSVYAAAAFLGLTAVLQQQFFADVAVLRSRAVFGRPTVAQSAFALVHLAGLWWLVPSRFVTGAFASWAASLVVGVAVLRAGASLPRARPAFAGADLVRRGLPTWLVTATATLLLQSDQVVVGAMLGTSALGLYTVLGLGAAALLFVPEAFATALWPVAGARFGSAGESPAALADLAARSVRGIAVASAAVLALALAATDVIVPSKLPRFAGALAASAPYLAGTFLLAVAVPLRYLLVTAGAGRAALRAQVAALVAAVALESVACAAGWGLVGVASAGAIVACALLAALLAATARAGIVTPRAAMRLFAETGALLAAALVVDLVLAETSPWLRVGVPFLLAAAAGLQLLRVARSERAE